MCLDAVVRGALPPFCPPMCCLLRVSQSVLVPEQRTTALTCCCGCANASLGRTTVAAWHCPSPPPCR